MASIKQIKSFIIVADLKSFTKAADVLFMTQPAVSWQIKALEEHVGLPLIERNDKRVVLTEAGKQFYRDAKEMLAVYDRAMDTMDDYKGLQRGKLKLGASTIPGEYLMPKYIGNFKKGYPGVDLSLTISDTGHIVDMLLDRSIDLGVVGAKIDYEAVEFVPFIQDELIMIAASDSDIPDEINVADVANIHLIVRETYSGTQMVLKESLASHGIKEEDLKITMELGSTQAVITAAVGGLGAAFVSKLAADAALKAKTVKQVVIDDLSLKRDLYVVTLKNTHFTRAVDAFHQYLMEKTG